MRAKQNMAKQQQTFVDSDFYDNHSQNRTPQPLAFLNRMGSTSPVSSRASGFVKQTSLRTKRSQINSGTGGPTGGKNADSRTHDNSSLLDQSDITNNQHRANGSNGFSKSPLRVRMN